MKKLRLEDNDSPKIKKILENKKKVATGLLLSETVLLGNDRRLSNTLSFNLFWIAKQYLFVWSRYEFDLLVN